MKEERMKKKAEGKRPAVGMVLEAVPADLYEAIHCALRPYERAEAEMARKWGSVARLVSLVPPDLAARFGSALDKMLGAVRRNEAERCADRVAVCIRGLAALDKEADEAMVLPVGYVGFSHNRRDYVVALDRVDLPAVEKLVGPGFQVVSLQELIEARSLLLTHRKETALQAIRSGTGGQIVAIRGPSRLDDPLPF
jgi:hypothetical protein